MSQSRIQRGSTFSGCPTCMRPCFPSERPSTITARQTACHVSIHPIGPTRNGSGASRLVHCPPPLRSTHGFMVVLGHTRFQTGITLADTIANIVEQNGVLKPFDHQHTSQRSVTDAGRGHEPTLWLIWPLIRICPHPCGQMPHRATPGGLERSGKSAAMLHVDSGPRHVFSVPIDGNGGAEPECSGSGKLQRSTVTDRSPSR